jgi:membrane associated rhomboid family serine protease
MEYFFTSAPVTSSLLLANIVASMVGFGATDFITQNALWIQPIREQRQWHRVLTSGFLHVERHASLREHAHALLFRSLPLEQRVRQRPGLLILYFGSLLGGSIWDVVDKSGNKPDYRAIGASGAISGLMSAVGILFPFADDLPDVRRPAGLGRSSMPCSSSSSASWPIPSARTRSSDMAPTLAAQSPASVLTLLLKPECLRRG